MIPLRSPDPWRTAFASWHSFRWSGDVLIGTDPTGREWSVAEIRGSTAWVSWPVEGEGWHLPKMVETAVPELARTWVHDVIRNCGGWL